MLVRLPDVLNVYVVLLLIAIPIAIALYLLAMRRDRSARPPAERRPAAPPVAATALARAALPAAAPVAEAATPAPRAPAPELAPAPPATVAPPPGLAAHLLLVDDSAVARAKLRRLFEGAGYSTALAKDGVEALQMLGRGRYALMITDLEMPEMNGVELIATVADDPDTEDMPIIAITGHDDLQAKVHEYSGLFGIFRKPWNDRELLRRVETLVRVQRVAETGTATA